MAAMSYNLKAYCDRVSQKSQWKLDKKIDFEHDGVQTHLGAIADGMDEWEGPVAEALGLSKAVVAGVKAKHPDNLNLQAREALHHWQEKNGLDSTYRNLIAMFLKAGKTSFAEAICKALGAIQGKTSSDLDTRSEFVGTSSNTNPQALNKDSEVTLVPKKSTTCDHMHGEMENMILAENEAKIQKLFAHLVREVLRILKGKKVDMEEFIMFVMELFTPGSCIPQSASEIFTIFCAISSHCLWSYSHYSPLKSIAEEFAKTETEQLIVSYQSDLANFFVTTKLADYFALCHNDEKVVDPDVPLAPNPAKYDGEYFQKLTIKIGRPVTELTLQYVADIWKAVAQFFLLPSLTALLDRLVEGSLVVSWFIPHLFAMQIRVNSSGGEAVAFYRAQKIIEVMIDDEWLYRCETPTQHTVTDVKLALLTACEKSSLDQILELLEQNLMSDFDFSQYDDTPLIAAVRGNAPIDIIEILLLYPFNVNGRDKNGCTALMFASQDGRTDVVELLMKHNADVNASLKNGRTALMYASQEGRTDIVEILIKHNVDLNARDENGVTALMVASEQGKTDVVELLIDFNSDVNARTKGGWTALMVAIFNGRVDIVELLISKCNADINSSMKDGWTSLMVASFSGNTDVVKLLLKYNADVNVRKENGFTALMAACQKGRTDIVELLIKENAIVNARKENGVTALMVASVAGKTEVVQLLINHNADVNAKADHGMTALMLASRERAIESDVPGLLMEHNADLNAKTEDGWTALMIASREGKTNIVDMLLEHITESNVNAKTENGLTALAVATQQGKVECVKSLLNAGANPNIEENEAKWTPLFFACKDEHKDIVQLLVEHGADVNHKDMNKLTAYDAAKSQTVHSSETYTYHASEDTLLQKEGIERQFPSAAGKHDDDDNVIRKAFDKQKISDDLVFRFK